MISHSERMELADQAAKAERHDLDNVPSCPLDLFLWLQSPELDRFVASLADEINASGGPRRERDKDTEEKFLFSIKIIILNLLMLRKFSLKTLLAVQKSAGAYTFKTRYDQPLISYRALIPALDGMVSLGYVQIVSEGFWDHKRKAGKVTRVQADHKLAACLDRMFPQDIVIFTRHPNEETIRQKDANKKLIDYEDAASDGYTSKARSNLDRINACLNRHWYDLDLSTEQFEVLHDRMAKRHQHKPKKPPVINYAARSLYRIYNNGDADVPEENFKQGGRFYGGWWISLISEYRKYITINGKPTVELDYSNLHPHILYAMEGLQMEGDAYLIEGIADRDLAKETFNRLLNGTGTRPKDFDPIAAGMEWAELTSKIRQQHAPIAKHFGSGYGVALQFKDSEVVENVLLHFAERDIPCLPIHDSMIVHHDLKDELQEVMLDTYRKVFGMHIGLKEGHDGYELFIKRYRHRGENTDSIDDILNYGNRSQYERRLNAWYEHLNGIKEA